MNQALICNALEEDNVQLISHRQLIIVDAVEDLGGSTVKKLITATPSHARIMPSAQT